MTPAGTLGLPGIEGRHVYLERREGAVGRGARVSKGTEIPRLGPRAEQEMRWKSPVISALHRELVKHGQCLPTFALGWP